MSLTEYEKACIRSWGLDAALKLRGKKATPPHVG